MFQTKSTIAILLIGFLQITAVNAGAIRPIGHDDQLIPTGKGWGERPIQAQTPTGGATGAAQAAVYTNGITYHNGPLILGATHIYYIWYGDWSNNTAPTILTNFASSIGGSPYYNINTTYYDKYNRYASNLATYAGSTTVSYPYGTALSDFKIRTVVRNAIVSGSLPKDSRAVYFVLTSADVTASSGFCTQYCGWHSHSQISGADIKFSFVGNPDRCPNACTMQTVSPNGNAGADGMASVIAHELEETVTDPDFNAWYDSQGLENADKCAWTFGNTYTSANGGTANMNLGGYDYLIQQNWVNASGGYCALSY